MKHLTLGLREVSTLTGVVVGGRPRDAGYRSDVIAVASTGLSR